MNPSQDPEPRTPQASVWLGRGILLQTNVENQPESLFILGTAWLEDAEPDLVGRFFYTNLQAARRALEEWVLERTANTRDFTPQNARREQLENAPSPEAKMQVQVNFDDEDEGQGYSLSELHYSQAELQSEWLEAYRLTDAEGNTRFRAWIKALEPGNP